MISMIPFGPRAAVWQALKHARIYARNESARRSLTRPSLLIGRPAQTRNKKVHEIVKQLEIVFSRRPMPVMAKQLLNVASPGWHL